MKNKLATENALLADAKALASTQRASLASFSRPIEPGLELCSQIPVYMGRGGLVVGLNPLSNKAMLDAAGDDA